MPNYIKCDNQMVTVETYNELKRKKKTTAPKKKASAVKVEAEVADVKVEASL